ncbi:cdc42 homolog [Saccostrea echinata]|uniref:cdc42 homolog n=1 Tax=Saccostrea echinata TaxID=191078 RepID=UPI002A801B3F|nr:cdc42 homolog [Saccostrea echinata]
MVVAMDKFTVQCSLVGDGMVGKSSLAKAITGQILDDGYIATTEDNFTASMSVAGDKYSLSILDLSGQHDYEKVRTQDYRSNDIFVVCFSTVDRESLENVKDFWIPEIRQIDRKRPVVLVGTQTDLRKEGSSHVTKEEGENLAKQIGAFSYLECSAVQKTGVKDVFEQVVMATLKCRKRRSSLIKRVFSR